VRVGIDIGQKVDPTAIAVAEMQPRIDGDHWVCRFLERLPLGTTYPAIANRLAEIIRGVERNIPSFDPETGKLMQPEVSLESYVDATGVGQPVVDVLNASGLAVTPVYFTHGDRRSVADGQVLLGKAWLVSRLKTLFQQERIHLPPQHPEAEAMARELEDYEIKVSEDANDRYGAFKVGSHDDLVTALGLAVQVEPSVSRLADWLPYFRGMAHIRG
jgi:hypothetical protein